MLYGAACGKQQLAVWASSSLCGFPFGCFLLTRLSKVGEQFDEAFNPRDASTVAEFLDGKSPFYHLWLQLQNQLAKYTATEKPTPAAKDVEADAKAFYSAKLNDLLDASPNPQAAAAAIATALPDLAAWLPSEHRAHFAREQVERGASFDDHASGGMCEDASQVFSSNDPIGQITTMLPSMADLVAKARAASQEEPSAVESYLAALQIAARNNDAVIRILLEIVGEFRNGGQGGNGSSAHSTSEAIKTRKIRSEMEKHVAALIAKFVCGSLFRVCLVCSQLAGILRRNVEGQ